MEALYSKINTFNRQQEEIFDLRDKIQLLKDKNKQLKKENTNLINAVNGFIDFENELKEDYNFNCGIINKFAVLLDNTFKEFNNLYLLSLKVNTENNQTSINEKLKNIKIIGENVQKNLSEYKKIKSIVDEKNKQKEEQKLKFQQENEEKIKEQKLNIQQEKEENKKINRRNKRKY